MGIVNAPAVEPVAPLKAKRKSIDFSKLGPLKKSEAGPMRYSSYRDSDKAKSGAAIDEDAMESDDEVDRRRAKDNDDDKEVTGSNGVHLSPDDARKQGELAEGVGRLKVYWSIRSSERTMLTYYHSSNVHTRRKFSVTSANLPTSTPRALHQSTHPSP